MVQATEMIEVQWNSGKILTGVTEADAAALTYHASSALCVPDVRAQGLLPSEQGKFNVLCGDCLCHTFLFKCQGQITPQYHGNSTPGNKMSNNL